MTEKEEFITLYLDDYVRMAYRRLTKKVDPKKERELINNIYYLMDMYCEGDLSQYIYNEEIV